MPGGNVFGCIENGSCFGLVNSKKWIKIKIKIKIV